MEVTIDQVSFVTRTAAAIIWTVVLIRFVRNPDSLPATTLRRTLTIVGLVVTLWVVSLRGATILGLIPDRITAPMVPAAMAGAIIVGLALLTQSRQDEE